MAHNSEVLVSNLMAEQALQVHHEAHEYTKLLEEALQVAQDLQAEMRKLDVD